MKEGRHKTSHNAHDRPARYTCTCTWCLYASPHGIIEIRRRTTLLHTNSRTVKYGYMILLKFQRTLGLRIRRPGRALLYVQTIENMIRRVPGYIHWQIPTAAPSSPHSVTT